MREWYCRSSIPKPTCGQESSVGNAKPTFQRDCVESSYWQCLEEMGAVGRFRYFRVMEKTRCWQTKPSGQQKQSCKKYAMKPKDPTVKVKKPAAQFEEPGEDTQPNEDCKMVVDEQTNSHKKLEMRNLKFTDELRQIKDFKNMDEEFKKSQKDESQKEVPQLGQK